MNWDIDFTDSKEPHVASLALPCGRIIEFKKFSLRDNVERVRIDGYDLPALRSLEISAYLPRPIMPGIAVYFYYGFYGETKIEVMVNCICFASECRGTDELFRTELRSSGAPEFTEEAATLEEMAGPDFVVLA